MTPTVGSAPWVQLLERIMRWMLRHWLLLANSAVVLYSTIPWLSPLARAAGYHTLGRLLFALYTPLCHQLAERSFFLYGYQVAFCHRDTALYTTLAAGGLLFGLLRRQLQPAPLRVLGWLSLPILLDGGSHLLDDLLSLQLRSGSAVGSLDFWLRMATGALFAIGVLITIYPRLDRELRTAELAA